MTDFEHEHAPVDPSAEDQRRKAALQAHMEASLASAAEIRQHAAQSERLRTAHKGLFGHATGADLAASVQERAVTVGTGTDAGRPLERDGGAWDTAAVTDSPCPPRADLRYVNQTGQQPTGESPLARWARER
jgi:hypothetical protein